MRLILLASIALLPCCSDDPGSTPGRSATLRKLVDIHGAPVPDPDAETKARAAIFITVDCPIANGYAPEIGRIVQEYSQKGVRFVLVHVDPDVTDESAKGHQQAYNLPNPIVLDPGHELAAEAGITVTPEVAVYRQSDGELAYRGRIDDLYPKLGAKRLKASVHDLRDALDAVIAGKTVANPRTKAVGCQLPDPN